MGLRLVGCGNAKIGRRWIARRVTLGLATLVCVLGLALTSACGDSNEQSAAAASTPGSATAKPADETASTSPEELDSQVADPVTTPGQEVSPEQDSTSLGDTQTEPTGSMMIVEGKSVILVFFADETDETDSTITLTTDRGHVVTCTAILPGPEIMEVAPPANCEAEESTVFGGISYILGKEERDLDEPVPEKPPQPTAGDGCSGSDPGDMCSPGTATLTPQFTWLQIELGSHENPELEWSQLTIDVTGNGHEFHHVITPTYDYSGGILDVFQLHVQ